MKAFGNIVCLLFIVLSLAACATTAKQQHASKCMKIGQEWTYDSREQDKDSRVVIVDAFMNRKKQRFYIIRVTGVEIDHPHFRNYFPDHIPYFIISEKGLELSLTQFIGEAAWNPHFDRHYQNWRRQNTGNDYFGFTIKDKIKTLAEVLEVKLGA